MTMYSSELDFFTQKRVKKIVDALESIGIPVQHVSLSVSGKFFALRLKGDKQPEFSAALEPFLTRFNFPKNRLYEVNIEGVRFAIVCPYFVVAPSPIFWDDTLEVLRINLVLR